MLEAMESAVVVMIPELLACKNEHMLKLVKD
jgi:hypothetical protein